MPAPLTLSCPAKINLTLRILTRRADGYHDLDSLFCPITLADTLHLDASRAALGPGPLAVAFTCSDPDLPVDDSNLAVRAARLFAEHQPLSGTLTMHLEKAIPHGAGLGGGSSDAAAVLQGLNKLFNTRLAEPALVVMAAVLGSDVPFFLRDQATHCTGRGEILGATVSLPPLPLLLIKPPFPVDTPWAYQAFAAARASSQPPAETQILPWGTLHNDLEPPVHAKFLVLPELKSWLLTQPEVAGALMSGSGSTTFAILHSAQAAPTLRDRVRARFGRNWWTWIGATVGTPEG